jgi:hypothetical protein
MHKPFDLERLESRRLWSAFLAEVDSLLASAVPDIQLDVPQATAAPATFDFTISGSFNVPFTNPDIGKTLHFHGTGTVGSQTVSLNGPLHLPGFIISGHATGKFTLTYADGTTQVLSIRGPLEPGFGPLPSKLHFTIPNNNSSSSVTNPTQSGHIDVIRGPHRTFTFVFHQNVQP